MNVTSHRKDTEICYEIPQPALRFALSPRSSIGESSTSLRMTYSGFDLRYSVIMRLMVKIINR